MSKFAIGEQVENVADDHESGAVVAVFPTVDRSFWYLLTRTVTAHCCFSPRRSWLSPLPGGVPHDRQPNHARDLRDRTDGARR